MNIYLSTGIMNSVKIYPDTVYNGLVKIGGVLGLIGLVVSIAYLVN